MADRSLPWCYCDICLGAGMDGYLTKLIEQDRLRDLIAELSTRSSLRNLTSADRREGRCSLEDSEEEPRLI